jgi:hypothetical protein
MWYSSDSGRTWNVSNVNTFNSVFMVGTNAIANHFSTGIWYSSDSGSLWQQSNLNTGSFFRNYMVDTNAIAVSSASSNNGIWYSLDSGHTWQVSNINTGYFSSVSMVGTNAIVGSISNGILYSYDSGRTWQASNLNTGSFTSVFMVGTNAIVTGFNDGIWYSSDSGRTWQVSNVNAGTFISSPFMVGTNAIAIQPNSGIWYSPYNPPTPLPDTVPLSNICFPKNTPVSTDQGSIFIENIVANVNTICSNPILSVTKTINSDKYLICFEKNALGKNMPSNQTIMSKSHLIFFNGKMIPALDFLDKFNKVKKVKYNGEILYNILLEKYTTIVVNNLICETLHPENCIAKLYKYIQKLTHEEEQEIIKLYNYYTLKRATNVSKNKQIHL